MLSVRALVHWFVRSFVRIESFYQYPHASRPSVHTRFQERSTSALNTDWHSLCVCTKLSFLGMPCPPGFLSGSPFFPGVPPPPGSVSYAPLLSVPARGHDTVCRTRASEVRLTPKGRDAQVRMQVAQQRPVRRLRSSPHELHS